MIFILVHYSYESTPVLQADTPFAYVILGQFAEVSGCTSVPRTYVRPYICSSVPLPPIVNGTDLGTTT